MTQIPYARFLQMLRVINQEQARAEAWDLWIRGAGNKNETFAKYAQRIGAEARTPLPAPVTAAGNDRTIERVKSRLGRLYRPPIKA